MAELSDAGLLRETGKAYFFGKNSDAEKKSQGLKMILEAHKAKDPEATYLVARLLLDGVLKTTAENSVERALMLMCFAANEGCVQARAFLNQYCRERYTEKHSAPKVQQGVLTDFDGVPIRIKRQGLFTPIDAVLTCENGKNILTLRANISFIYGETLASAPSFERAVIRGIMEWQGEYEVFGGQQLTVRVELTSETTLFDSILVMPVTKEMGSILQAVSDVIGTKERKEQMTDLLSKKRSFASSGRKWSVNSRKIICIQSEDEMFRDYYEIMHVAKHEFGHALGLGDLYSSAVDSLDGVEKGTYTELDSYVICDKYYNLVMCDHHGPISNNDIEMVVLAFRENTMQLYQPGKLKGKISAALGKGN